MSAIAARKARLAQQLGATNGSTSSSSSSSSAEFCDQSSLLSRTLSPKRKAKAAEERSAHKIGRQGTINREVPTNGKESTAHTRQHLQASTISSTTADLHPVEDEEDENSSDQSSSASTDEEDIEEMNESISRTTSGTLQPAYSTFVPIVEGRRKNWHLRKIKEQLVQGNKVEPKPSLILGLAPNQTLLFVGKAMIKVLDGHCSISGAQLTPQHHNVVIFSPLNSPLPVLQAPSGNANCKAIPEYGFNHNLHSVVIEIRSITESHIADISLACPLVRSNCFSLPSSLASSSSLDDFHPVLQAMRGMVSSSLLPSWEQGLSLAVNGQTPSVCLIKGPKRVGKSTFSRHLLNRLVSTQRTSVAYLETDLGQAEFGPPGLIALHLFDSLIFDVEGSSELVIGPSWTSLRCPLRSHFIGDTTPKDDPTLYNHAITDILLYYNASLKSKGIPLIVNTQGWVKGLGADLLKRLEDELKPTHIFDMMPSEDDDEDLREVGPSKIETNVLQTGTVVTRLEASPPSLTRDRGLNAVEARILNLVSYFYSIRLPYPAKNKTAKIGWPEWDFSLSIIQQRPFVVNVEQGLQAGLHILPKGARVEKQLQLMALNGSIVAIVSTNQGNSTTHNEQNSSLWKKALSKKLPTLQTSTCLGLAIVRSIDVERGIIYLVTPLSIEQVISCHEPSNCLCLVKGAIELPIWLSLNYPLIEASQSSQPDPPLSHLEGVALEDVPYLDFTTSRSIKEQVIGSEKRRIRRNIQRRSQRGGGPF